MADEAKITVVGASGTQYTFWVYSWGTSLKAAGGVYLVLRKGQNGNYTILYVGQTGDLSERFDAHHKASCFNRNSKTHIAASLENSEAKRLSIEADLIKKYQPTCNG